MGAAVSTKRKQGRDTVSDSEKCKRCRHPGKFSSRKARRQPKQEVEDILPVEPDFVNTTKRMSRYPQRHTNAQESIHVSNSDFPFFKPKAVTVRPRPVEQVVPQPVNSLQNDDINNVHSTQFLLYNERHPLFEPDKADFYPSRCQNLPYHYVNDRRWSVPNVMPANNFQPDNVLLHKTVTRARDPIQHNVMPTKTMQPGNILVHKTVAQLRASNQIQPYGRHYSYVCDAEPECLHVDLSGSHRPPTPSPNVWYPAHRTSDYLVASSLLAMEQQHDRRNNFR